MKNKYKIQKEWLIFVIGLILAGRTSYRIWRLIQARQIVTETRVRTQEAYRENELLKKRLAEVSSDAFVEREARDKLGMGKPGEVIVILPNQNNSSQTEINNYELKIKNWRRWWDLYVRL